MTDGFAILQLIGKLGKLVKYQGTLTAKITHLLDLFFSAALIFSAG